MSIKTKPRAKLVSAILRTHARVEKLERELDTLRKTVAEESGVRQGAIYRLPADPVTGKRGFFRVSEVTAYSWQKTKRDKHTVEVSASGRNCTQDGFQRGLRYSIPVAELALCEPVEMKES